MSEAKTAAAPEALKSLDPPVIDYNKTTPETAVANLIRYAVDSGASDLFFCANENMVAVQVRQLGLVRSIGAIPAEIGRRCLAYVKANAGLDTSEKRRPMDGRWIFDDGGRRGKVGKVDNAVDLRINIIPTLRGEDFAIRLLSRGSELFVLEKLGMEPQQLDEYKAMLESPSGLILITGPTGSGKTATLYASLARLNTGTRKINTIEDPVEYSVDGLHQSQVNAAIELGFSDLLRSVLRQSPDVVMIGEIRDKETAQIAVHAANSGVLVFATLHAATAPGAIQSIRSLGTHPHFLATSLRGVIAQRLVRTLCPRCRTTFDLTDAPHTFDDVRKWLARRRKDPVRPSRLSSMRDERVCRTDGGLRVHDRARRLDARAACRRPPRAGNPRQRGRGRVCRVPPGRAAESCPRPHQHRGSLPRHPHRAPVAGGVAAGKSSHSGAAFLPRARRVYDCRRGHPSDRGIEGVVPDAHPRAGLLPQAGTSAPATRRQSSWRSISMPRCIRW